MSTSNIVQASSFMMPANLYNHIKEILEHSSSAELSEELKLCKDAVIQDEMATDADQTVDFRFAELLIKNFRRYSEVPLSSEAYFGLKFTDDKDRIYSKTFLIGRNGSGKSTLFNAAEFLFTKQISEALYRNIGNVEGFMGGTQRSAGDIIVLTNGQGAVSDTTAIPLPISQFFISENSILEASRSLNDQDNWFEFFCDMLGVGAIYRLVNNLLPKISDDISSIRDRVILQNQRHQLLIIVKDLSGRKIQNYFDKLDLLCKLIASFQEAPSQDSLSAINTQLSCLNLKSLSGIKNELKTINRQLSDLDKNKVRKVAGGKTPFKLDDNVEEKKQKILNDILPAITNLQINILAILREGPKTPDSLRNYEEKLMLEYVNNGAQKTLSIDIDDQNIESALQHIKQYSEKTKSDLTAFVSTHIDESFKVAIEQMFKEKFLDQLETLHLDISNISSNSITFYVEYSGNQKQSIPVNRYFNTFRFRLFFLSLQSLLCVKMMQQTGIVFPLLFDDIFYANDYINKNQLVHFFDILDSYAKQNDKVNGKLQLIFFSHDEQLINVVHKRYRTDKSIQFARVVDISHKPFIMKNKRIIECNGVKYTCCQVALPIYKSY